MKLPSLKVSQRSTSGEVVVRSIPRSFTCPEKFGGHNQVMEDKDSGDYCDDYENYDDMIPDLPPPSLHHIAQKAASAAWKGIRSSLLKTSVEMHAMLPNQMCIVCKEKASCRCIQCAPWAFYCCECWKEAHSRVNIFHKGEIWEVC